jgi:hypothetical protein
LTEAPRLAVVTGGTVFVVSPGWLAGSLEPGSVPNGGADTRTVSRGSVATGCERDAPTGEPWNGGSAA